MSDRKAPVFYTPEIADEICRRLSVGESLNAICCDDRMPSEAAVRLWSIEDKDGFSAKYTRAREAGMDALADSIVEIADTEPDPATARNRIDARKWLASKYAPKRFGDRQIIAGDEDNPLALSLAESILAARARSGKA